MPILVATLLTIVVLPAPGTAQTVPPMPEIPPEPIVTPLPPPPPSPPAPAPAAPPAPPSGVGRGAMVTGATVIGAVVLDGRVVPEADVRLRDALTGRTVAQARATEHGEFRVTGLAAGTYVPEQLDAAGRVAAFGDVFDLRQGLTEVIVIDQPNPHAPGLVERARLDRRPPKRSIWIAAAAMVSGAVVLGLSR